LSRSSRTSADGARCFAWIAGLALANAALLFAHSHRAPPSAGLQRATRGVGLGPAASAAWSMHGFDARAAARCEVELWPLPGLPCPDPGHGTTPYAPDVTPGPGEAAP
jgi:hypothetical protein